MITSTETQALPEHLPALLLPWFASHARDLPWRADREPYHVWLSEVMLQQTRVEAVKGYYTRFLARLPEDRRLVFVGDGVPVHAEAIQTALNGRAMIAPANLRDLRADAVCVLAASRPETWVDAAALRPIYLRAPQAERERKNKN